MKELHFYPGQHILAVVKNGKISHRFEAWGGPEHGGSDPRMAEIPTTPGNYIIHHTHAYSTPSWPMSRIKWGTPLRDMGPTVKDVWYKLPSGKWGSVKNDIGISRNDLKNYYNQLYNINKIPVKWVFNDFGPIAIRFFKDLNGNKKLDGAERLSGEMLHTTPENEAEFSTGKPVILVPSHGCIHIKPQDRNMLQGLGLFIAGTVFKVHSYNKQVPQSSP